MTVGRRLLLVAAGVAAYALASHALMLQAEAMGWVALLCVLQHAGIHLVLAWIFGRTLRPGKTPFITALAERVHGGRLTPAMHGYTRRLTAVWSGYFVAMALVSVLLYIVAPWSWWSLFGNVLTPLALAAMFGGEHWLRYRLHPEFERATIAQAVNAYRRSFASDKAGP